MNAMLPRQHGDGLEPRDLKPIRRIKGFRKPNMKMKVPDRESRSNAVVHCQPCPNSISIDGDVHCNYLGCNSRVPSIFIEECPKGIF